MEITVPTDMAASQANPRLPAPRTAARPLVAGASSRGITLTELMLAVAIVGILAAIALPAYDSYRDRVRTFQAVNDIGAIGSLVSKFALDQGAMPASLANVGADAVLDPWGNAYQYVNHDDPSTRGLWRKDKNIVPINSDFDLFSMGKDGGSAPPLTARMSRDDIVRASNGRFIGPASEYDP